MSSIIDWIIESIIWGLILWYLDKYKHWRVNNWRKAFLLAAIYLIFTSIIALVILPMPFYAKMTAILLMLPIQLLLKALFIRVIAWITYGEIFSKISKKI